MIYSESISPTVLTGIVIENEPRRSLAVMGSELYFAFIHSELDCPISPTVLTGIVIENEPRRLLARMGSELYFALIDSES